MKSLKRLITVILAVAMIITSLGIVAFADSSFSDITDSRVDEAVAKLVAYGVITGYDDNGDGVAESFKPDNQITRAEFAAIVTRMKGVAQNLPKDSVTGFWDLDSDSSRAWARPYVKAAADLKIINGFEDGSFRAAEPVTYEQAVKMLVCAIGYETVAKSEYNKAVAINPKASWSAGYIAAANKHGITKYAITSQITLPATRGTVALLTSNAYEVPALKEDENGNLVKPGEGEIESESNMITIAGYVTDTFYTGLDTDDTDLNEDEIIIDAEKKELDGKYTLSRNLFETMELDQYIGRKVTAYYDNLEGEITSIRLEKMNSKIIEEQYIVSASATQIKTEDEDEKTSTENISGATFIVNGKYVEDYDFDGFENGTVEIFSALGKKIVIVSDYDVFVTLRLDKSNDKIYLKYANYNGENFYEFPARNSDKPKIYVKASGSSSYKLTSYESLSLSQYDVINYLESPEGSGGDPVRKMYVTKGSKSGKVTSSFGEGRIVELDNKIMYLTQQYNDFEGTTSDKKAPFSVSDSYTYYVDCNGQIAAVNYNETSSTTSWSYGYIVEVYPRDKEIGIIETNGSVKYYSLKDKVEVDNDKMDASDVYEVLKSAAEEIDANANDSTLEDTDGYAQPIKYSISGGKIEALDTVLNKEGELADGADSLERGDDFTYDGKLGNSPTSTSSTRVTADGVSYSVTSSTFVLYVPKDRADEDSYAKMTASTAFAVSGNRYVEVFGVDASSSNKLAKMVIVYGTNPTLNFTGNTPYLIVTGKGSADDNDTIKGYKGGSTTETTVIVSEDKFITELDEHNLVSANDVEEGDIIRYITDSKGEAIAIELLYDSDADVLYDDKSEETQYLEVSKASTFVVMFGEVVSKYVEDSRIEIDADKIRSQKFSSSTKVFKLTTNGDVEVAAIEDVYDDSEGMDASKILMFVRSASTDVAAQTIYIIEE